MTDQPCDLPTFCADTRQALQQQPLDAALPVIAGRLTALLANPVFVNATFDDGMPPGKRVLYEDAATGFRVLAHVQPAGKGGAPHDHGASWAVYGTARGCTEMVEYRRVDDGTGAATLQPLPGYSLLAGQARAYGPGAIHATAHPGTAWVLRITGTNLDNIPRFRFRKAQDTLLPAA